MSQAAAPTLTEIPPEIGAQIEQLTRQSTVPVELGEGLYLGINGAGVGQIIDVNPFLEVYGERPRRKIRVQAVHSPEAFIAYVKKHGLPETELYGDVFALAVTALIDAGQSVQDGNGAGRAEFRTVFQVRATPAWVAWKAHDAKWLEQEEMAEHFEDRLLDFIDPDGATMLEIAQTFQASRSGAFESSERLATGETALVYREDISATAGVKRLQIPDQFVVQLQPFEGSKAYKVNAHFRYRIRDKHLRLSYKIDRPEDLVRTAFDDVTKAIGEGLKREVWQGSAP